MIFLSVPVFSADLRQASWLMPLCDLLCMQARAAFPPSEKGLGTPQDYFSLIKLYDYRVLIVSLLYTAMLAKVHGSTGPMTNKL